VATVDKERSGVSVLSRCVGLCQRSSCMVILQWTRLRP
jgi:hypothetical protein